MAHGSPHEEAEHASHHAQDPFDRRVAMSMVVIAAVLAMVKVMGHRTHNDTLAYQIKSGVHHTQASDQWNFFQAKKMREVLAKQEAKLLLQAIKPAKEASTIVPLPDREKRLANLTKELKQIAGESAEKDAQQILADGEKRFKELLEKGYTAAQAEPAVDSEMTAERYRTESKVIQAKAEKKEEEAKTELKNSEHKHHQASFFDLGELGVELALVLSSVAILTKRPGYWYGGLGLGVIGCVFVAIGFLAH